MRKNLFISHVRPAGCRPGAERLRYCSHPCHPVQTVVMVQTQVVQQVVTATLGPATPTPLPAGSIQVTAAGATFPLPLYSQWTYAYQFVDPSVAINYNGVGSGAGKTAIINNTVDFAGSDSLLSDQNYTDGKDLQMYPMVAGAVVPGLQHRLQARPDPRGRRAPPSPFPSLSWTARPWWTFITPRSRLWNDPEIVALNPGLKDYLPSATITTVHRSDASGTTEIFTRALSSFSPDWKAGGAQSVQWPGKGLGGKGNAGVAAAVLTTPNSIGYVELAYAISNSMSFAQMVNQAGKTVTANGASVNAAMAEFANTFTDKLTDRHRGWQERWRLADQRLHLHHPAHHLHAGLHQGPEDH